jgi:hypothetical protein
MVISKPSIQILDFKFVTHMLTYPYLSLVRYLTMTFIPEIISMRTNDAPHALGQSTVLYGDCEKLKMANGKAAVGSVKPLNQNLLPRIVSSSGAVSPEILATDSRIPVAMPFFALLRTMVIVVFHRGTPKAKAASLIAIGTSLMASSVVLVTIGIIIMAKAKAPASTDQPIKVTINAHPNIPITIEGMLVETSVRNLAAEASLVSLNSAKYIPENTPIGIPNMEAIPTTINVP